jgi:hypothetical protein
MPLDEINLFNQHLRLLGKDLQNSTTLPLLFSIDDHDQVILFDVIFWNDHFKSLFTLIPACLALGWDWSRSGRFSLEDLRSQGDDFHKPFGPKFSGHWPENSGPHRIPLGIDEDSGVIIKFDVRTIQTLHFFPCPDDDGTSHIPFLNLRIGEGIFDGYNNDISQGGIFPTGSAEDFNASQFSGA